MKNVIAIFGISGVGKSSVAVEISARTGGALRSCGEMIKDECRRRGTISPSIEIETFVDNETVSIAQSHRGLLIVEGRYLDRVLYSLPNVIFFRLVCDEPERLLRIKHRRITGKSGVPGAHTEGSAPLDLWGDSKLHTNLQCCDENSNCFEIDTSGLSVQTVANILLSKWEESQDPD